MCNTYLCVCACARMSGYVRVWGSRARWLVYVWAHARSLTYPSCTAHAPYDIVICSLLALPYFSTFSHKRHDFRNKKSCCILNACFDFLHTNLSKTFLILRRNQRDIVVNVKTSLCTLHIRCSFYMLTWIIRTYFRKKSLNTKSHQSPSSGRWIVLCGGRSWLTWRS